MQIIKPDYSTYNQDYMVFMLTISEKIPINNIEGEHFYCYLGKDSRTL